jgi:hypothetical protein
MIRLALRCKWQVRPNFWCELQYDATLLVAGSAVLGRWRVLWISDNLNRGVTFDAGPFPSKLNDWTYLKGNPFQVWTLAANTSVTGLTGGTRGEYLYISNDFTGYSLTFKHASTSSASGNRFSCPGETDYVVASGGGVIMFYDGTLWCIIGVTGSGGGGGSSLTNTYIGVGNVSNALSGSSGYVFSGGMTTTTAEPSAGLVGHTVTHYSDTLDITNGPVWKGQRGGGTVASPTDSTAGMYAASLVGSLRHSGVWTERARVDMVAAGPAACDIYFRVYNGGWIDALKIDGIAGNVNLPQIAASKVLGTDGSSNVVAMAETGSGSVVRQTSPTLITPALGTPTSGNLASCTGLPIAGGGTGQATAYAALDALTVQGADIASASTTNLATATGVCVTVTGTTTITALGTASAGVVRVVTFTGALTLTHNATSLILPGAANITTSSWGRCSPAAS